MKTQIYAVKDNVAGEYGPPFTAKNDGVAQRMFEQMLDKAIKNTTEYDLYVIGSYDSDIAYIVTGTVTRIQKKEVKNVSTK